MLSKPIFITGIERSGSTLVVRAFQSCGAVVGTVNKMRENKALRDLNHAFIRSETGSSDMPITTHLVTPKYWKESVEKRLKTQKIPDSMSFLFKDSGLAQVWSIWHETFPEAKWIIVRRRTGDIIHSFMETTYMTKFDSREGWLDWVHQYEDKFREMIAAGIDYKIVWPERMRDGNFEQMKETVEWCDLQWNESLVETIQALLK